MDKNTLKILAGEFIIESKVKKDAKLQLVRFVKNEADESQLKSLILDGEITTLSKQAKAVLNDRFNSFYLKHSDIIEKLTQRWRPFGGINRAFGECAKKCGRIAISSKASTCKEMCIAKRDQAIRVAREKAKAQRAAEKGKMAKSQKSLEKAKQIASY